METEVEYFHEEEVFVDRVIEIDVSEIGKYYGQNILATKFEVSHQTVDVDCPVYIENLIEQTIEHNTDRFVENTVERVVEKRVEHHVDVPVYVERIVEQIVYREVPKIVYKEVPRTGGRKCHQDSQRIVEKPVERIVYRDVEVEVDHFVDREVFKEEIVKRFVDRDVVKEVQNVIDRPIYVDNHIDRPVYKERIIEKPVERIVEKHVQVERIEEVPVYLSSGNQHSHSHNHVHLERENTSIRTSHLSGYGRHDHCDQKSLVQHSQAVAKTVEKIVEVPVYKDRVIEVEKKIYFDVAKRVDRIVEKIIKVPVVTIIEVPVDGYLKTDYREISKTTTTHHGDTVELKDIYCEFMSGTSQGQSGQPPGQDLWELEINLLRKMILLLEQRNSHLREILSPLQSKVFGLENSENSFMGIDYEEKSYVMERKIQRVQGELRTCSERSQWLVESPKLWSLDQEAREVRQSVCEV